MYCITFRLQESWDAQAVMCCSEGLLNVLSGRSKQGSPHVHQTGVNGLDDGKKGQTTCPALAEILDRHSISAEVG